ADALREHGARLKQADDLGQRIVHELDSSKQNVDYIRLRVRRALPMASDMKNVLITGCSSGYGLETARHFHARGWNVIATMRTPRADVLPRSERLRVLPLDVTKAESIAAALTTSGPIDVLVNNAGIGLFGAFEVTPLTTVREVFEANTFGVMAMTQAVLPQMR